MKKIILLVILCMFASFATVSAEKQEWFEKNYDFTKVKTIYINAPQIPDKFNNGINEKEIPEIFFEKYKMKNVRLLTARDIIKNHIKTTGIDIMDIYAKDKQAGKNEFLKAVAEQVDVLVYTDIGQYGSGQQFVQASQINMPTTQTSTVTNSTGMIVGSINTPSTTAIPIPAHNATAIYLNVRFSALNAKTGAPIWTVIDARSKVLGGLENTTPKDMFGRAVEDFADKLDDKIGNK